MDYKHFLKGYTDKQAEIRPASNAPTFAYRTVYGKDPEYRISGQSGAPKRLWRNVPVDEHMKDEVLERLNDIPDIEGRSSEEGKSEDRPAFFIFRMADSGEDDKAEEIARNLRKQGIISRAETGSGGRPRIIAAQDRKYGDPGWEEWWDTLPDHIKRAVIKLRLEERAGK